MDRGPWLMDWQRQGWVISFQLKFLKGPMIMFVARCIFPVLMLICAGNSYAEITKDKVQRFYESIVSIRSIVPPEARTAASLGVKREGNGVAIDENHILTIGYIVLEAESIEIGLSDGRQLPAKLAMTPLLDLESSNLLFPLHCHVYN